MEIMKLSTAISELEELFADMTEEATGNAAQLDILLSEVKHTRGKAEQLVTRLMQHEGTVRGMLEEAKAQA